MRHPLEPAVRQGKDSDAALRTARASDRSVALGCLDAAVETWVERDGTVPLPQLLDRSMGAVHPLAP